MQEGVAAVWSLFPRGYPDARPRGIVTFWRGARAGPEMRICSLGGMRPMVMSGFEVDGGLTLLYLAGETYQLVTVGCVSGMAGPSLATSATVGG